MISLGAGFISQYVTAIALNIALLLALSSILYGLWWIPRENYQRLRSKRSAEKKTPSRNWVRGVPFLASLMLFVKLGLLIYVLLDVRALDEPTVPSVLFTITSVLYFLLAWISLGAALLSFRHDASPALRWHSLLVSVALVGLAIVFLFQELVGVRLWQI